MYKSSHLLSACAVLALAACSSNPKQENIQQAEYEPVPQIEAEPAQSAEYAAMQPIAPPLPDQKLVFFEFDRAEISSEFMRIIDQHAAHLAANPDQSVRLEGHADERGTPSYNIGLGERRAKAVEQALLLKGATPEQFEIVSYGEQRPMEDGAGERFYSKNRRVEFVYQ